MLVPVWLSAWQLECCLPDVAVGEQWEAPLVAHEVTVAPVTSLVKMLRGRSDGAVEFRGLAQRHVAGEAAVDVGGSVVDVGVLMFYAQVGVVGWMYGTTKLYFDSHGGTDDVPQQLVTLRGHVRAITQQGKPVPSTAIRRGDTPFVVSVEVGAAL